MKRSLQFLACLSCCACVHNTVFSQAVAYVYVANNPKNSSTNEISPTPPHPMADSRRYSDLLSARTSPLWPSMAITWLPPIALSP